VVPAQNFLPAPAGWDPATLTLTEPLANGLRCAAFPEAGEAAFAVVIGGGPLGLSCLVGVRHAGTARVWVVEGRPRRRDAALALGAERVLHPEKDDVKAELRAACPQGADLVIEAVGLEATIQASFLMVRPGGNVIVMGVTPGPIQVHPGVWLVKELTIRSSIGCDLNDHRAALDLLTSGRVDAAPLVTRRIGIEEVPKVLAELAAGADEVKVVAEHRSAVSPA
jgi:threonine dehydrogenase-like Zn-dependent dehydrogenase